MVVKKLTNGSKKKDSVYWRALEKTWLDFSQVSSIHGLRYITDPGGNLFSKTIWIFITLTSFVVANVLVYTFYLDFHSNPTRMNIETDHAPLPELMFPGITVCSANYISSIKALDFIRQLKLPQNVTEEMVLSYLFQVTGFRMKTEYSEEDMDELQGIINLNRYSIIETMSYLRISCKDLLFRCRWEMKNRKCNELFQISKTYSGSCCSFNIDQKGLIFLRKRASMHGLSGGLSIIVQPIFDDAAKTAVYSHGVKLLVHENSIFPSETTVEKLIPVHSEVLVRIRPTVITCSNQVRSLSIAERNCLFPEERKLQFFPEYSDENCDLECQILGIIEHCKCIPYYFIQQDNIPVCNFTKIPCLVENFDSTIVRKESSEYKCECPSSCQSTIFDVQTNSIPLKRNNVTYNNFYDGMSINSTVIHVYINSQAYRKLRRDLLTNLISLISNFGSAYSLFIGMSIISVIEIIYFFTIVYNKNIQKIQEDDNKVALFTRRLDKIAFKPWKIEQIPVVDVLN